MVKQLPSTIKNKINLGNINAADIHDKVYDAYYGKLGNKFMQETQARIHWICSQASGSQILDIGCGQGICALVLGREGKVVTGIDVDPTAIEEAKKHLSNEPQVVRENVTFYSVDAANHTYGPEKYNTVILTSVLENLINPERLIRIASEALSSDGRLVITLPFGINDYIDHKHTFYLLEPYQLISKYFEVFDIHIIGKWIGIVAVVKNEKSDEFKSDEFSSGLVKKLEMGFLTIERDLQNKLSDQNVQRREADVQHKEINKKLQFEKKCLYDEKTTRKTLEASKRLIESRLEDADTQNFKTRRELLEANNSILTTKINNNHLETDFSATMVNQEQEIIKSNFAKEQIRSLNIEVSELQDLYHKKEKELNDISIVLNKTNDSFTKEKDEHETSTISLKSKILAIEDELNNYKSRTEILNSKEIHKRQSLESKILGLSKQINKYKTNLKGMDYRNKRLKTELDTARVRTKNAKNTLSFRLGNALITSTHSFKDLIKLPWNLYSEYNIFKKQRRITATPLETISITKKKDQRIISKTIKNLKIASIMDEFTYNSFRHECDLFQITPGNWESELTGFRPDLLFIESAWKGKNDLWAIKVSNCSTELIEVIQWCHNNKVNVIFWNKEDPVHFNTFIPAAKLADLVFTTDIDCVPKYKKEVKHDNVYYLPFAAQPALHNPIETQDRKDAFNFAGSYYLRYPERQRDFEALIGAVKQFRPVEIYDRNFDNPHPHYTFPDEYLPMILGRLPFEEIDKAYKGYKYGINMNTIKQSQSMFARRVFELLASNTLVISNFSRGMRLLFGDLVISSDDTKQISSRLEEICSNEIHYRKLRLLGLRKVMSEHTYQDRLSYILSKINNTQIKKDIPTICMYATVNTSEELSSVFKSYKDQLYSTKELVIIKLFKEEYKIDDGSIKTLTSTSECIRYLSSKIKDKVLLGEFCPHDYYGKNYLTDLSQASQYSESKAFGKGSYYSYNKNIELHHNGIQYKLTDSLHIHSSLVRIEAIGEKGIMRLLNENNALTLDNMLSTDEFNYCKNGIQSSPKDLARIVDDLYITDQGVCHRSISMGVSNSVVYKSPPRQDDSTLPSLNASELFELFPKPSSTKIKMSYLEGKIHIDTKLGSGKHSYLYANKAFTRENLNFVLNSQFRLNSSSTLENMYTVFEFQDKDRNKISHSINPTGKTHALAIPRECVYLRLGLKFVGSGTARISKLLLGSHGQVPFALAAKSKKLVLTKQYPSYNDIYKYGFLHTRVRAYKRADVLVDIFRINNQPQSPYREFENIDVATGNATLLDTTLRTGRYDHVLVHLLDENMWNVLKNHIDRINITIWIHGAEIQIWQRRSFEFDRMTTKEIARQKRLSANRVNFWTTLLNNPHKNIKFIFVSNIFKQQALGDLKLEVDKKHLGIIHNYIDSTVFPYTPKSSNKRLKILSIRPFTSQVYGNDLTVQAIIELSKRDFFHNLEFLLVGDGDYFDKDTRPLKGFKNVKLKKTFLFHSEISKLHKEYGIFLIPTRSDTQGVSRDEAMSSGLVPVTTNISSIPEFVDSSCGMVVEPENPKALADAIEFLYRNPNDFLKLSKAASERVRLQSNHERTIGQEIAIIN